MIAGGVALAFSVVASASLGQTSDPLSSLVASTPGASACFQRTYDAAHLKRHPRQTVISVLLSVKRDMAEPSEVQLRMQFADKRRADAVLARASCSWEPTGVNQGQFTGKPLVPNFPKESGLGCLWQSSSGASGDEAAQFPLDVDPQGHSITLYVQSSMPLWPDSAGAFDFGSDDRTFRLGGVDSAACAALEKALPDAHVE
jgi:hypothetical protein